jgi:hypothetical protein
LPDADKARPGRPRPRIAGAEQEVTVDARPITDTREERAMNTTNRKLGRLVMAMTFALVLAAIVASQPHPVTTTALQNTTKTVAQTAAGNLPLSFEVNRGQSDPQAQFASQHVYD